MKFEHISHQTIRNSSTYMQITDKNHKIKISFKGACGVKTNSYPIHLRNALENKSAAL